MKTISEKKLRAWLEMAIEANATAFEETGDPYWMGRKVSYRLIKVTLDGGYFDEDADL